MEKNLTPKPHKKNPKPKSRAPTESDNDLPAPPKRVVARPALIDKGDKTEEDLPPKNLEGAKKNKGKGKAIQQPDNKGIKSTNQTRGGNIPKPKRSILSHLIRVCIHLVTCLYLH